MHILRPVAKEGMLLKETYRGLMVLVAGHHKEVYPAFRLPDHIHQIADQTLEDIELPGKPHIVHALWRVGTKSRSHAPRQKHGPHLSCADGFQACGGILFLIFPDPGQLHGGQGRDHPPLQQLLLMPAGIQNVHVRGLNLFKQRRFLRLGQFLIIFQHMLLPVSF